MSPDDVTPADPTGRDERTGGGGREGGDGTITGVFVGLTTLDLVQRVPSPPGPDGKATATWQGVFAGGPAANAAVTFAALGGSAVLVTRIGSGPVADLVRADLDACGVAVVDAIGNSLDTARAAYSPAVSSVVVDERTGRRQVVSTDAGRPPRARALPPTAQRALASADVLLLDGHHVDLAALALEARRRPDEPGRSGLSVVLDAGRWKPGMADLAPSCTHVVCSAAFRLDGELGGDALLAALLARGARLAAVTAGGGPITWRTSTGRGEVVPPAVEAVDTLGAGDVLHGAYAHALASAAAREASGLLPDGPDASPVPALAAAARVAALSCTFLGTRSWRDHLPAPPDLPPPRGPR